MLKRLKFLVYRFVLFLAKKKTNKRNKAVLIIKTDEIGDYVLWRNFATYYQSCQRFLSYKKVLCGNIAWKNLYENFDAVCFDEVIWLDKKQFKSNMLYRYRFLKNINARRFDTVINTVFSRSYYIDDSVVLAAYAEHTIGMPSNDNNVLPYEKGYDKNLYSELAPLPMNNIFEFTRNKNFTIFATKQELPDIKLNFDNTNFHGKNKLPENYFVIFPGSNKSSRIWPASNFAQVASFIHNAMGYHVVICGAKTDLPYAEELKKKLDIPFTDLCGKTNLFEFLEVLKFSKCLVSIDTGSVHLAAAVQCPVFGVYNGSQYGRFAPYPGDVFKNFYAAYPAAVENDIKNGHAKKYRYLSPVKYDEVSAEMIIELVKLFFEIN